LAFSLLMRTLATGVKPCLHGKKEFLAQPFLPLHPLLPLKYAMLVEKEGIMKNLKRTIIITVLSLMGAFVILGLIGSKLTPSPTSTTQSTPASIAAHPTTTPTTRPTSMPVIAPTATAHPVIVPTHAPVINDNAQLGSSLASFKARYGQDTPQSAGVTAFIDPTDNGPLLHGGDLIVTYNKSGKVTYVTYAGPDNWTHMKYVAMMLTFMPMDAVVVTSTPSLSAYSSVSIGNFDEKILDGAAGIYSV
jgi:hypothetical protein